ncbi:MAG: histidinol-phosphatase [Desulfobacterales bacterium]
MKNTSPASLVSIHGGHSDQFCSHARDSLEAMIQRYIEKGFAWVGITEHMPPSENRFRYPEETQAGLGVNDLYQRFARYMDTGRRLQEKYRFQIQILVGFESETYSGSPDFIDRLTEAFHPDYIVGSLHHVDDLGFDCSSGQYLQAAAALGGIDALYMRYFDLQHEMLRMLRPAVVGHFDLIRIFDPRYPQRILQPEIFQRIIRNLELIKNLDLILDYNVRALLKGADEPYISEPILRKALEMGINVVPGDDSHSIDSVGVGIAEGIRRLEALGFDTDWRRPEYGAAPKRSKSRSSHLDAHQKGGGASNDP